MLAAQKERFERMFAIRLSNSEFAHLQAIADKHNATKTEVMRSALHQFISEKAA